MHKLSILMKEVGCIPRKRDIVRKGPLYHTSLFNGDYVAVQFDVEGLCARLGPWDNHLCHILTFLNHCIIYVWLHSHPS
mgnify:FL=1